MTARVPQYRAVIECYSGDGMRNCSHYQHISDEIYILKPLVYPI